MLLWPPASTEIDRHPFQTYQAIFPVRKLSYFTFQCTSFITHLIYMFYFLPVCSSLSLASCNLSIVGHQYHFFSCLLLMHFCLRVAGGGLQVRYLLYLILPTPLCTSDIYFIKSSFYFLHMQDFLRTHTMMILAPCLHVAYACRHCRAYEGLLSPISHARPPPGSALRGA